VPFAAALSEHPVTAHAIGEATGQVLERLGEEPPDLVLLFATRHHTAAFGEAADAVRTLLRPGTLAGCTAASVLANAHEAEETPAITLWAGRFGPVVGRAVPGADLLLPDPPFVPRAVLLLADPFSFPPEPALAAIAERWPGVPVIGGMASAAAGPGGNRLLLDGTRLTAGAVAVLLGPGLELDTVVSQGCRPIGQPFTVTAAEGQVVQELGGQPAMTRLQQLVDDQLSEDDVAVINGGGLHVGKVIDERKVDLGRGDFLVRNVLGANRIEGWIAVDEPVQVGDTLQFHLRDAEAADDDLRALLTRAPAAESALLFTCTGRGRSLFGAPAHDAEVLEDYTGPLPAAGMFCAGEFGAVGGRNFLHGFTASIALLREA
jgi:small ligand-binding sensory domain FIST